MFHLKLLIFWAALAVVGWIIRKRPESSAARAALTWIGPTPRTGENWAHFQMRWAAYSTSWLAQILFLLSLIAAAVQWRRSLYEDYLLIQGLFFALALGGATALAGALGFLFKAAKAKYIGPNPVFEGTGA